MADPFLSTGRLLLRDVGFASDPGLPERADGGCVFYHYTRADRVDEILREGLRAWRAVNCPNPPPELAGRYLTAGFLVPLPRWLGECPYFGDLGWRLARQYVGDTLLRVVAPGASRWYVADCAHRLELRYYEETGERILDRGYDLHGRDHVRQAYVNSYIPVEDYQGGHIAPVFQLVVHEPGVAVPPGRIQVCRTQPFKDKHSP